MSPAKDPQNNIERLAALDHLHLWHPFTQMKGWQEHDPCIITEARGVFLKDLRGRWLLDGVSSLWVNIHGHRKPELDDAIKRQVDLVSHSTLLGMGNVPSIELAARLAALMDKHLPSADPARALSRVFYSDNGSTAVEVALKMAFQYWQHRGVKGKHSFISLKEGYHGDTLGAVSVGGIDIFHEAFGPLLFKTHKAPSPSCYHCTLTTSRPCSQMHCLDEVERILSSHAREIAAMIVEPMVQAAGGMRVFPPGYLSGIRALCSRHDVLLIADEVATGFGRTGKTFACEHEAVVPDIICLSKGLTGGYMPLAVTIAGEHVYEAFLGEFPELKTFFHGHSYTGNQLGCAVALASLEVLENERVVEGMTPKVELLKAWLDEIASHEHVGSARGLGLMAGVEIVRQREPRVEYAWEERMGWAVAGEALERGVFIRPLGNVIVIMPPLAITLEQLRAMLEIISSSINAVTGGQA